MTIFVSTGCSFIGRLVITSHTRPITTSHTTQIKTRNPAITPDLYTINVPYRAAIAGAARFPENQLAPTRNRWCYVGKRDVYKANRACLANAPPNAFPPASTAARSVPRPLLRRVLQSVSCRDRGRINAFTLCAASPASCKASWAVPGRVASAGGQQAISPSAKMLSLDQLQSWSNFQQAARGLFDVQLFDQRPHLDAAGPDHARCV